jgi:UDP-N-acetylmuramyl pentapeptide phosphotransferase/UDP-N-acetylglucosamine-1-phosphate transferase
MYGLFGIEKVPGAFSLALSYLTIIVVVNSFNLIDGIDGLAASLGILTLSVFGAYFLAVDMQAYAILAFSMAGSLIAFIIFNHHPAKIFMGDSGSLMIGLVNAILVIKFINVAYSPGAVIRIPSAAAVGFGILVVPLLDTLRVFSIRIINGRSPFTPDRNHVHHLLLDKGLGHVAVASICVIFNIAIIAFVWFAQSIGPNFLLSSILVISFSALGVVYHSSRRRAMVITKGASGTAELKTSTKVLALTKEIQVSEN